MRWQPELDVPGRTAQRVISYWDARASDGGLTGEGALALGRAYADVGKRRRAVKYLKLAARDADRPTALRAQAILTSLSARVRTPAIATALLAADPSDLEDVFIEVAVTSIDGEVARQLLESVVRHGGRPWRVRAALELARTLARDGRAAEGISKLLDLQHRADEDDEYATALVELWHELRDSTERQTAAALLERAASLETRHAWLAARELARLRDDERSFEEAELLWAMARRLWRQRAPVGPGHDVAMLRLDSSSSDWVVISGTPDDPGCGDTIAPFIMDFEFGRASVRHDDGELSHGAAPLDLVLIPDPPVAPSGAPVAVLGDFGNLVQVRAELLDPLNRLRQAISTGAADAAERVVDELVRVQESPGAVRLALDWAVRAFPSRLAGVPCPPKWVPAENACRQIQQLLDGIPSKRPANVRDSLYDTAPGLGPGLTGLVVATRAGDASEQIRCLHTVVGALSNYDLERLPSALQVQLKITLQRLAGQLGRSSVRSQHVTTGKAGLLSVRLTWPPEPERSPTDDTWYTRDVGAMSKACRDLYGAGALTDASFLLDDKEREILRDFAAALMQDSPADVVESPTLDHAGTELWDRSVILRSAALVALGQGEIEGGWQMLQRSEEHLYEAEDRHGQPQVWYRWKHVLTDAVRLTMRFTRELEPEWQAVVRQALARESKHAELELAASTVLIASLAWGSGKVDDVLGPLAARLLEEPTDLRARAVLGEWASSTGSYSAAIGALVAAASQQIATRALLTDAATLLANAVADGEQNLDASLATVLDAVARAQPEVRLAIEKIIMRLVASDVGDRVRVAVTAWLDTEAGSTLALLSYVLRRTPPKEDAARVLPDLGRRGTLEMATRVLLRVARVTGERWPAARARELLERFVRPGDASFWIRRGELALVMRDKKTARLLLDAPAMRQVGNDYGLTTRALLQLMLGETERAFGDLADVVSRARQRGKSPSPSVLAATAQVAIASGDLEAARSLNEDLTRLQPSNHTPWYWLGRVALAEGDSATAVRAWRQALGLQAREAGGAGRRYAPLTAASLAAVLATQDRPQPAVVEMFSQGFHGMGRDARRLLLEALRWAPPLPDPILDVVLSSSADGRVMSGRAAQVLTARLVHGVLSDGPSPQMRSEARNAVEWAKAQGVLAELLGGAPATYPRALLRMTASGTSPRLIAPEKLEKLVQRLSRRRRRELIAALVESQPTFDPRAYFSRIEELLRATTPSPGELAEILIATIEVRASAHLGEDFSGTVRPVKAVRRMSELVTVAGEDETSLGVVVDADILRSIRFRDMKKAVWTLDGDEYTSETADRKLDAHEAAWLSAAGVIVRDARYVVRCLVEDDDRDLADDALLAAEEVDEPFVGGAS